MVYRQIWRGRKGAEAVLCASRPLVVFEYGLVAAHYDTTSNDVFDFLSGCDLDVYLLDDWLRGRKPLTREAFHEESTIRHWYFIAAPAGRGT